MKTKRRPFTTFKAAAAFAKSVGVNVERESKKYQVWTDGAVVDECSNLEEVYISIYEMKTASMY